MHGWNKFSQVIHNDRQLISCWSTGASLEECSSNGTIGLNILCTAALRKRMLISKKRLYKKEIRHLIRTRKELKRNYDTNDDHLCFQLKILEKRIDERLLSLIMISYTTDSRIVVRTPFGNTDLFPVNNLVRQGTVLGPILNNCSLDQICKKGIGYHSVKTFRIC